MAPLSKRPLCAFLMPLNTQSYTPVDYTKFNYPTASMYQTPGVAGVAGVYPFGFQGFADPNASIMYQPVQLPAFPSYEHQRQMRIEKHRHSIQNARAQQTQQAQQEQAQRAHQTQQEHLAQLALRHKQKPPRFVSGYYDLDAPKRKYRYRKNSQRELSPASYVPADPNADTAQFSKEDIIILMNILPNAEIHKWKYISNRLSKTKSKKLNTEYCINKFHQMYALPFNQRNSPLDANYSLRLSPNGHLSQKDRGDNFEGVLGSSLGYVLSRDGWNLID